MYYSGQTLKHKITGELVALKSDPELNWDWCLEEAINEKGETIKFDNSKYEPILDFSGNIVPGKIQKDGKPDISLKNT